MNGWDFLFGWILGFGVLLLFFFKDGVKYIQHSLGKDGNISFFCEKNQDYFVIESEENFPDG